MKTDYNFLWGSHLPVLMKLVYETTGDVLELGMGLYSTPFLHWACYPNRTLFSYESDRECYELNKQYKNGLQHQVFYVENWNDAFIDRGSSHIWDVALVDHAPSQRRVVEIERLKDSAKYIVVHDTQRNKRFCNFESIYPLFKYRYDYTKAVPYTTVLSNFVDVSSLDI